MTPRVLDAQGLSELQEAEAAVQENFEAHQQAIAKWRSLDTERRARLRGAVIQFLDDGRVPKPVVEEVLKAAGFTAEEISQEIGDLVRERVVREWHDGRFLSLPDSSSS